MKMAGSLPPSIVANMIKSELDAKPKRYRITCCVETAVIAAANLGIDAVGIV